MGAEGARIPYLWGGRIGAAEPRPVNRYNQTTASRAVANTAGDPEVFVDRVGGRHS